MNVGSSLQVNIIDLCNSNGVNCNNKCLAGWSTGLSRVNDQIVSLK